MPRLTALLPPPIGRSSRLIAVLHGPGRPTPNRHRGQREQQGDPYKPCHDDLGRVRWIRRRRWSWRRRRLQQVKQLTHAGSEPVQGW